MGVGTFASAVHIAAGGGGTDVLMEPFNSYATNGWVVTSTPVISASGRTGNAAECNSVSDRVDYTIPAPSVSPYITVGAAFWTNSLASTKTIFSFRVGTTQANDLNVTTTGALVFARGGLGVGPASAAGLIVINTWYYVELQFYTHDTLGWFEVRIDEVTVHSVIPDFDTLATGAPNVLRLNSATGISRFDDLYLSTGVDAVFKGDITV